LTKLQPAIQQLTFLAHSVYRRANAVMAEADISMVLRRGVTCLIISQFAKTRLAE